MKFLKKLILLLIIILCIGLGGWIFLDNPEPLSMTFLGFRTPAMPKGIWLLSALFIGCVLGILSSYPLVVRLKMKLRQQQKQNQNQKQLQSKPASER